jgi:hypothetical protein
MVTSEMLAGLSPDYLHASLFIPTYQTAVGIISPVEFAKRGLYIPV